MTLHEEMTILQNTKIALKQALIAKGQSVLDSDSMQSYINKIKNIPSGPQETGVQYLLKEIVEGTVEKIDDTQLTILRSHCLQRCQNLTFAKFTKIRKICSQAFHSCTKFYTLILDTSNMVCLENVDAFQFTPMDVGMGKIYVKDSLVSTYKTDKEWSKVANVIFPISQYSPE